MKRANDYNYNAAKKLADRFLKLADGLNTREVRAALEIARDCLDANSVLKIGTPKSGANGKD